MRVDGTSVVVTREDGLERGDAVVVRQLDAAQEGGVHAGLARGGDAAVDAGGVAVPDVDGDGGDGLAGVGVDVLHLEVHVDAVARLGLLDVRPEVLADDVVRAVGDLGRQDAAGVGAEDVLERGEHVVIVDARHVVVDRLPLLHVRKLTLVLPGSFLFRSSQIYAFYSGILFYLSYYSLTGGDTALLADIRDLLGAARDGALVQRSGVRLVGACG